MISSGVTQVYDVNVELQLRPDVTGAALAVAARKRSTFPLKNAANSNGAMDDVWVSGGSIKPDIVRQSFLESPALSIIRRL